MPNMTVVTREGVAHEFNGPTQLSVMEIIRNNGISELTALCGGCCSCATCHVYIDVAFLELMPKIGVNENDVLEGSLFRKENSRLSCQVLFTDALDGLRLTIAPED